MDRTYAILYFLMFTISYGLFFYILLKSNFEQLFKKGKITEIRAAYFLVSFLLASIFAFFVVELVEVITKIIIN